MIVGLFLSGCGNETDTLSERVSGPASNAALPIRVDSTPTPAATVSPSLTVTPTNQTPQPNAESTLNAEQTITPTPDAKGIASALKKTPSPQETPTPTPSPVPSPAEKAVSVDAKSPKQDEDTVKTDSSEQDAAAESEDSEDVEESEPENDQDESKSPVVTTKGVKLEKIVVCSAVKNRNASGAAKEFSYKDVKKIYTWTKFSGIKSPTVIKHHYYLNGKAVGTVKLTLKYAVMRSWSQKSLTPGESVGKWKVVITTDNDKEILTEQEFTVVK